MLLDLAIGDSYGRGFEFAPAAFVAKRNDASCYVSRPRKDSSWEHPPRGVGFYTDDTQMSIAISESILSGEPWTPLMLADGFLKAFRRDPRNGYARRFQAFLSRVHDGEQFLREIMPKSNRSGAAMRAGPIGVLPSVGEVVRKSRIQAAITHNTSEGMASAMAASLVVHYFAHECGPKSGLAAFVLKHVDGPWAEKWSGSVGNNGVEVVRAVITALESSDSMTGLLRASVGFCGDVDTVAAVAAAAGSYSKEIAQDLPATLVDNLENGTYGRDYIVCLDEKLEKIRMADA
jgi:ADP-ribosylglycohydrolase